ncbi:MAG: SDR family NAD(P)-dependent oxidoreductase [Actinomycetota bacterium]
MTKGAYLVDLNGKVCIVTGASSGIGRRTAQDLARRGAVVCAVARREDLLVELVESLSGGDHSFFAADVSDPTRVRALARHVEEIHGRCDVLINNAGFSAGGAFRGTDSLEDLHRVIDTNLFGAIHCSAELLPLLVRAAPSHIVNVTSVAGRLSIPGASAYCASKFALVGWTESARYDLESKGVYLSSVEPGPIPTEGFPQSGLVGHPLLRMALGSPGDVSRAIIGSIEHRKPQRVVPRPYYLLQFVRLLAPRLYRSLTRRILAGRSLDQ